ncbi:MazG-like family protein [Secundilactobacillus kimchicus]|uniref:MazG-like family protein n=1 Tax=Secundilactobacillus kimchicus TaxID=528209 RepID=UPI001C0110FD|nr:MazG-like family protein [Secundilactobacillus kimchicus]
MNELIKKIQQWSIDRGLDQQSPDKQLIKLVEEVGELAGGRNKQNTPVVTDSLGDMFVVMVIYCQQMGLDIEECVSTAVGEISDRKGQMVDGVFVKEADLDPYDVKSRLVTEDDR